jgi:hypothetical protein
MSKTKKIIYWVSTIWLALGMVSTALVQLMKGKEGTGGLISVTHLGYPVYLLTLLGVWKILGVIAILVPRFPLLKEWAYAGFFFVITGALFSHFIGGGSTQEYFGAILLLILIAVSWYSRPADRKMVAVSQQML